jgi:hypothetical protein
VCICRTGPWPCDCYSTDLFTVCAMTPIVAQTVQDWMLWWSANN